MLRSITTDLVEAFSVCPRKAFLLMTDQQDQEPHEYLQIISERAAANKQARKLALAESEALLASAPADLRTGASALADVILAAEGLEAHFDFLHRVKEKSPLGSFSYEPVMVVGTCRYSRADVLGLAYRGLVLGHVQGRAPSAGKLLLVDGRSARVKLVSKYKEVQRIMDALRSWGDSVTAGVPQVELNEHCPTCPFREACFQQAKHDDNLTLLDRMTPKLMRKYQEKGIFTVKQLSYLFKPRRSRKKGKRRIKHSLELQALAIRTGKVHVEHLPEVARSPVELFLDLEGVPDRNFYYLAGLLVCRDGNADYESFWADDASGEAALWSALVNRLAAFPDAPVYHYGSYERKAFTTLAKRNDRGGGCIDRLVNLASSVYGKVYFPVRSNGLKSLGRFLGATWTDPQASGLQSLVWRHRWELTRNEQYKQSLFQYNREDCEAARLLLDRLDEIRRNSASDPKIDLAGQPKRFATETAKAVHFQFEQILKSAQADFATQAIRIRAKATEELHVEMKEHRRKPPPPFRRIVPKASRTEILEPIQRCPKDGVDLLPKRTKPTERTVVDLVFTKSGCRKAVTKYVGVTTRCPKCGQQYNPLSTPEFASALGHGLQAWTIYQRIILRLPYRIITQVTEHLFGIGFSKGTAVRFLEQQSNYYAPTEVAIIQAILRSDFVHVDETKINIQGVDHYVWVFTNGQHVLFRMTETREASIVREVLAGYQGVLISDFYPGYDSMPCPQQKCLVHLIRDINDDLWKAPFDKELEMFAVEVQGLLVPMLLEVDRYGLKTWHLRKLLKNVDRFYKNVIAKQYVSDPVRTYQKRFERYRDSLFTFLTRDGIPWENNMAERAIRHLAVQRKISGSFFKRVVPQYLRLLAISQTCRFQGKSFLKFLLSKETDLDSFRATKPLRYSYAVAPRLAD